MNSTLLARDIAVQPEILRQALPRLEAAAAAVRPDRDRPIWICGCGDGTFAGEAMAGVFRSCGWDFRPRTAAALLWDARVRPGDTVVSLSISGGTRRTVEAAQRAATIGARTIAVTLDPDSPLAAACDAVITLPYTPISRKIPHSLDYTMLIAALAAIAGAHASDLAARAAEILKAEVTTAREAVRGLSDTARFFFLGAGPALGSAGYGAAKMHEAGGLAAWAIESENVAHGANFMMRPGDLAVLLGGRSAGDARTATLADGLRTMGLAVSKSALAAAVDDPLEAVLRATFHVQTLCLAVAEARALDVTDPGRGTAAAEVQKAWFSWRSGQRG